MSGILALEEPLTICRRGRHQAFAPTTPHSNRLRPLHIPTAVAPLSPSSRPALLHFTCIHITSALHCVRMTTTEASIEGDLAFFFLLIAAADMVVASIGRTDQGNSNGTGRAVWSGLLVYVSGLCDGLRMSGPFLSFWNCT
jgi:hypothetical protein